MSLAIRITLWVAAIVGIVAGVLYAFFFDYWTVPGDDPLLTAAIAPTLAPGDVVLVSRRAKIERSHLMRCPDPQAPGRFVVARAVAQWGERLDLASENVSIDGHSIPSPRACDPAQVVVHNPASDDDVTLACSVQEFGETSYESLRALKNPEPSHPIEVEPGKWFLVSDDRHVHLDSRDFGSVESGAASGCQHVVFRLVGGAGFFDGKRRLTIIW
ncbi:MAG: S26 family signal peptidase [Polyangiaceae bacterium]